METKFLTLTRKDLMPYCKTMDFESVDIYSFNKSSKNLKENFDKVIFMEDGDKQIKIIFEKKIC